MTYGDPIEAHEDDHFVFAPHGQVVKPWDSGMLLRSRDSSPVWITHDHTPIFNLKVQQFHNSPHLIFWTGMFRDGFGRGNLTIMNQHYEVVTHVRTAEGTVLGDLHEARVTDSDSALIAYQGPQRMQLRGRDNWVRDVGHQVLLLLDPPIDLGIRVGMLSRYRY